MTHRSTALLFLLAFVSGCAHQVPAPPVPEPAAVADVPLELPNLAESPPTGEEGLVPPVAALALRDKVAQLVVPWIPGDYWADDNEAMTAAMRMVRDEHVGGFVVGLGGSAYDLAAKFNALQGASPLPLFIAADLESGPSARIRGATAVPGNMGLGATGSEQDAYDVGAVVAREARAVGINLVFAPVVDVNNNPANPIINVRSYGEDPRRVGAFGVAFIRGLREHGMLATAKHFPGHGDTGTDSHLALPVITAGRARLDSIEFVPFRAAIGAGVDAVMSAHVAMPGLTGGDMPATLSASVLDTLLRRDLGFHGLVVTDALNMGAIVSRFGPAQAAVRALEAGADVLLYPVDPHQAIEAVLAAVQRGEISEARIDSSVTRVIDAKRRAGLFRRRLTDLSAIARLVGTQRDEALAQSIAQRAIVLVKDSLGLVPLSVEKRRHVLVVSYAEETNGSVGQVFEATLRSGEGRVSALRLWPASGPMSYDSVRAQAREASLVCVLVAARPAAWKPDAVNMPAALAGLVEELARGGTPLVTVALGSPYLIGQVPSTPTYLIAWSDADVSERAAAQAVLGAIGITGRLPVSLPPAAPLGAGLTRAGRAMPAVTGAGP
ncbi:MAG: glycoside hydrolase family 3 protein [Gemmatimonadales bacterium]